jgi:hypothetical protein
MAGVMLGLHGGVIVLQGSVNGPKVFSDALVSLLAPFWKSFIKVINLKDIKGVTMA